MNTDPLYAQALATFDGLFDEALAAGEPDRTAMSLATAALDARPSLRTVLLKAHDARGFVFYTHLDGRKGRELQQNPYAALLFHWPRVRDGVQVRIEGRVHLVPDDEADAYFASRHPESRLGSAASDQSRPLPDRQVYLDRVDALRQQYPDGNVPRPAHWSGYRVTPSAIEFWQDRDYRLHERRRFVGDGAGGWTSTLLYP